MKLFTVIFFFISFLHGYEKDKVYIAAKNIKYKEYIHPEDLIPAYKEVNKKRCKDIDVIALNTNKYRAASYLSKGRIICLKNLELISIKKVNFNFGGIEVERLVESIKETKHYIKIKDLDGNEEKIYKDGRNR